MFLKCKVLLTNDECVRAVSHLFVHRNDHNQKVANKTEQNHLSDEMESLHNSIKIKYEIWALNKFKLNR